MYSKVIFIGNFLSKTRGSVGPSEQISNALREEGLRIEAASGKENLILRFTEIIYKSLIGSYDIMHVDVFSGKAFIFAELASLVAKMRGKKVFLNLHGGQLPERHKSDRMRFAKLFKRADKILTPSKYLQTYFNNNGFKIDYLPNPVNFQKFQKNRKDTGHDHYRLLWIRAFHEVYNPDIAIETVAILKKKYPNIHLTMIGPDIGLLKKSEELIKKYSLEKSITIVGPVKNDKISTYLNSHSVFLNTTSAESFGVALIEAAACGIPIVSTAVGEIPLLWDDKKELLLVKQKTPKAFNQQISRLLQSSELSELLARNAHRKALQFDWKVIKNSWLQLLHENN